MEYVGDNSVDNYQKDSPDDIYLKSKNIGLSRKNYIIFEISKNIEANRSVT